MRVAQDAVLPETCDIRRPVSVADGYGAQTLTFPASGSAAACRLGAPRSQQERVIADRLSPLSAYTVTLPAGTDVLETDNIVTDSRTLRVVGIMRDSYETAVRVVAAEVGNE
jgi:hypothetical protein